jgi:hypothetical protein
MNYSKVYSLLIEKRINYPVDPDEYFEKHHIIPKSLGGSNDSNNIVKLTPREHYIAHLLLTKMFPKGSRDEYKMLCAFMMMNTISSKHKNRYSSSRLYSILRLEWINSCKIHLKDKQKGKLNSQFGKVWINDGLNEQKIEKEHGLPENWKFGRLRKSKSIKLCKTCNSPLLHNRYTYCSISCSNSSRILNDSTKEKIRHSKLGKSRSDETKSKMSETIRNKKLS